MSIQMGKFYVRIQEYLDSLFQNICISIVQGVDDTTRVPQQQPQQLHHSTLASVNNLAKINYYNRLDCALDNFGGARDLN